MKKTFFVLGTALMFSACSNQAKVENNAKLENEQKKEVQTKKETPENKTVSNEDVNLKNEVVWMEDFAAAQAKAKAENKFMVVDFTGSDWCGWCKKLDKEVFQQQPYIDYAKAVVSVKLDYPRRKQLPADLKAQNQALLEKYGVKGFPTILVLNSDGETVGQTGYQAGGPEAYIKHLKTFMN